MCFCCIWCACGTLHPSLYHKTEIHILPSHLVVEDPSCNVRLHLGSWLFRQLSGTALTWEVKGAPQLLHNSGIYCGVEGNMVEILALKQSYTPKLSFPEQGQRLRGDQFWRHSHYEKGEFCEVLNLRRGMKYLNMELEDTHLTSREWEFTCNSKSASFWCLTFSLQLAAVVFISS